MQAGLDALSQPEAFALAVDVLRPVHNRQHKDALSRLQQTLRAELAPGAGSQGKEGDRPTNVQPFPLPLLQAERSLTATGLQAAVLLGVNIAAHFLDYSELGALADFVAEHNMSEHADHVHLLLHEAIACTHDMLESNAPLQHTDFFSPHRLPASRTCSCVAAGADPSQAPSSLVTELRKVESERTFLPQLVQRTALGVKAVRAMTPCPDSIAAFVQRVRSQLLACSPAVRCSESGPVCTGCRAGRTKRAEASQATATCSAGELAH